VSERIGLSPGGAFRSLRRCESVPLLQQLARGDPSHRDDVHSLSALHQIEVSYSDGGSVAALRRCGSLRTGSGRCSPRRSASRAWARLTPDPVNVMQGTNHDRRSLQQPYRRVPHRARPALRWLDPDHLEQHERPRCVRRSGARRAGRRRAAAACRRRGGRLPDEVSPTRSLC
jgi:hypothetical protein